MPTPPTTDSGKKKLLFIIFILLFTIQIFNLRETFSQDMQVSSEDLVYLRTIKKATFYGFEKLFDKSSGFPVDIASVESGTVLQNPGNEYFNKTSPTNIGLGFLYLILAKEGNFITHEVAYKRATQMLDTLEKLTTFHGFLYNWYYLSGDKKILPKVSINRYVSSLDNGDLAICLMATAGAFPNTDLMVRIEKFLNNMDFNFFFEKNPYIPKNGMINTGYDEFKRVYSGTDYSILNTESRMTVFVAIVKDNVPDKAWKDQTRLLRSYKTKRGENIFVVASWGGSLYETLFADELIQGDIIAPKAFRQNGVNMIKIHIDKGLRLSQSGIWGFSNGEVPGTNNYEMAGVQEIAYNLFPGRFVTPYSSFLALRYDTQSVIDNFKNIEVLNPKSFNQNYGFIDSIDPVTGEINGNILSLDKGIEVLALGNFINKLEGRMTVPDYLWKYLRMKNLDEKAETLIKEEESNIAFQKIIRNKNVEKGQNSTTRDVQGIDLLKIYNNIGVSYDLERARIAFHEIEDEDTIEIEYEVKERYSYASVYLKFDDIDVAQHKVLKVEVKGDARKGFPESIKIEIKYQGRLIQFEHVFLEMHWMQVEIEIPFESTRIDEIAFVFENSSVGNHRQGAVKLRSIILQ